MNPQFRCGLIVLMLLFSWTTSAHALLFERRKTYDSEISWFVYPVIGSIPGVQDFYGLGGTVSGIGGSESDITAVSLRGKAKYFDDDFQTPSPRGDYGQRWDNSIDQFEDAPPFRRKFSSGDDYDYSPAEPEDNFYSDRSKSRAAIPEQAASRRRRVARDVIPFLKFLIVSSSENTVENFCI